MIKLIQALSDAGCGKTLKTLAWEMNAGGDKGLLSIKADCTIEASHTIETDRTTEASHTIEASHDDDDLTIKVPF
ncbi:MAG TPA: hypothetical protein V6C65_07340 [Allocoleopsis sp.]